MKRIIICTLAVFLLFTGLFGCSTLKASEHPEADIPRLDQWLEGYAFKNILNHLKTNSFMKDLPFLIVGSDGEGPVRDMGQRIDGLTEDIRDRMITHFLAFPEIRVIRKHPVSVVQRPYALQELRCGRFVEPKMFLVIDIRRIGEMKDRQVRVAVRAMDIEKGEWIRGFSLQQVVSLTGPQIDDLNTAYPDQSLKGTKYAPFAFSQRDEMGAYLAANLSCMFSDAYRGQALRVFVDATKAIGQDRDIAWFIKKQLQFCNEIQLTGSKDHADWVIVVESRNTGAAISQVWIEACQKMNGDLIRGLATYAYYLSSDQTGNSLSGRWKIVNLPEGSTGGYMRITERSHGYSGDLIGADGVTLIKRGFFIVAKNRHVDWAYFDDRHNKTRKARGVLSEEGNKISVQQSWYPPDGRVVLQELIREEE